MASENIKMQKTTYMQLRLNLRKRVKELDQIKPKRIRFYDVYLDVKIWVDMTKLKLLNLCIKALNN